MNAANDTVKLAIYYLRKNGQAGGTIVLVASLAGYLASAGAGLYSAAKHGIVGLMRALKNDTATHNIAMSVVAPGISLTAILPTRGKTPKAWTDEMKALGVPINSAEDVALAVVWLMGSGMKGNGKGLLIQDGKCADLEEGLAKSRSLWMGEEMLRLFRSGRNAPLFENKQVAKL
jgi:NAD(P)-dependent dehydrogenase (short-subunit alcohol dehydrogenase family)